MKFRMIKRGLGLFLILGFICDLIVFQSALAANIESNPLRFERLWPALQQPWYFKCPIDIALDARGNFYVIDFEFNRIQKFTSEGQFILKWGVSGSGEGEFSSPDCIAVDASGYVYVADRVNFRIQKFTSDGQYVTGWKAGDSNTAQYAGFAGMDIDSSNVIYVTDPVHHTIHKYATDGTLIAKWGSAGLGAGQLNGPSSVASDNNGHVYVVDAGNHRIQKFTSAGAFVLQWGQNGDGNDEFNFGTDNSLSRGSICVDNSGFVYVSDSYNTCVKKFTSQGTFIGKYGIGGWQYTGTEDLIFERPAGLDVDGSGYVYVTDVGNPGISKFSDDRFVANWGGAGRNKGTFNNPSGIALDKDGYLYVSDTNNARIQKFSSTGKFISTWGKNGGGTGNFYNPTGIATDSSGNIYVADTGNNRIQKFTSDGSYLSQWGSNGSGQGEFLEPRGITVDRLGNIYVADTDNYRIQKFSSGGTYLSGWGSQGTGNGQFKYPVAVAADNDGFVYVADQINDCIQKFTSAGVFVTKFSGDFNTDDALNDPSDVDTDDEGNIYVVDQWRGRILVLNSNGELKIVFGSTGTDPGMFGLPVSIAVLPSGGRVYISESPNNRIQVFSKDGSTQPDPASGISKAIIVAGGGPYTGNTLWDATQVCTNYAYRVLTYQGFTKDSIYYLSSDSDLDLDGNGQFDDVDMDATNSNLEYAITNWARDAHDLLIYITDHGGDATFRMSGTELLSASDLNSWLGRAEASISGNASFIYDACQSGSFLPELKVAAGKGRILIASAMENERAYFTSRGSLSFSSLFWGNIFNGMSIGDAFISAKNAVEYTYTSQTPLLDDTGNGIGNEDNDCIIAKTTYVGNGTLSADDIPLIGSVSAAQTITNEGVSASIYAANVTDANGISRVWSVITPPGSATSDPSEPVLSLPILEMESDGNGKYIGTYGDFSKKGTYHIAVYAEDSFGNISFPVSTAVTQEQNPNKIDVTGFSLSENPQANSPVTITVTAQHRRNATLYYRFSFHPDYGTSGYDGLNWSSMTDTEWISENSVDYIFTNSGKYIVVVWVSDKTNNVDSGGIPILGFSLNIGDDSCETTFTGLAISGQNRVNEAMTFSVEDTNNCSLSTYYRFSVHPDYGTSGYDSLHWERMTSTEWISLNSVAYSFAEPGKYVVVVWGSDVTGNVDPNGIPIVGWSVDIE